MDDLEASASSIAIVSFLVVVEEESRKDASRYGSCGGRPSMSSEMCQLGSFLCACAGERDLVMSDGIGKCCNNKGLCHAVQPGTNSLHQSGFWRCVVFGLVWCRFAGTPRVLPHCTARSRSGLTPEFDAYLLPTILCWLHQTS